MSVLIEGIQAKYVKVFFSAGKWNHVVKDKTMQRQLENLLHMETDTSVAKKRLVRNDAVTPISSAIAGFSHYHLSVTARFGRRGEGLLRTTKVEEYTEKFNEFKARYWDGVANLEAVFGAEIAAARQRLGDAFNANDYPSLDDIKRRFYFEMGFSMVEKPSDVNLTGLDESLREIVSKSVAAQVARDLATAKKDLIQRATSQKGRSPLEKLLENLGDPTKTFRDSTIYNVRKMAETIRELNAGSDPDLESLANRLASIANIYPDSVRRDFAKRANTAQAAQKLMDDMKTFL